MAILESLYNESALVPLLDAIRLANTAEPVAISADAAAVPQVATPGQLDTLAYIADMRERLILVEDIGADALAALGSARRESVVEFLNLRGGIPEARMIATDPVISDEDDDGWLTLPFGLTAQ